MFGWCLLPNATPLELRSMGHDGVLVRALTGGVADRWCC